MGKEQLIRKLIDESLQEHIELQCRLGEELERLPKGSLIQRKHGGLSISVREEGRQYQIALSADDSELICELKKRRYITAGKLSLQKWINACAAFLKSEAAYDPLEIEQHLPEQYRGLEGVDIFPASHVNPYEWKNEIHGESKFYERGLIHRTARGTLVRSKSELMIESQLENRGLQSHYEVPLTCGDINCSADFEILHPVLYRCIYWEHFGMMDDAEYAARTMEKLKNYARNGIILGYNLFITYETRNHPLTLQEINRVIDEILNLEF